MDREVKLSFWQILASPFSIFKDMVTSKNDIEPEVELSVDSTDKTVKALAESSKSIDNKVGAYGNSGKAQRRETLKAVKVKKEDLAKQTATKEEKKGKEQGQKEDDYIK